MSSLINLKGKYKVVGSMFFSLLLSLLVTSLLINISSFSDSLCISRFLGDNAMASYSLVKPVFKFFGIITGVITSGLQIVLGAELGKGNTKNASRLFTFFFVICFFIGIVVLILGLTIPKQLAFLFGAYDMNSDLNQMAADFLKGVLIGGPFLLIYSALLPIYSYSGARKLIIGCSLINAVTDIVFNILNGKYFNLGMFGMGLSTTLGYVIAVIPMVLYLVFKKSGLRFDFSEFSFKKKGHVFVLGLPKAFKSLSTSLKSVVVNTLILTIGGSIALTASGVEESLFGLLNVLESSLPGVFISLACLYRLDKDKESCAHLFKILLYYTIFVVVTCTVIVIVLAPYILTLFNLETTESFDAALLAVRIGLIAVPLTITNALYLAYLQVTKKIMMSNIFNVIFYFVIPICVTLIFGFTLKTVGLWISIPVIEIVNTLIVWIMGCIKAKKLINPYTALFPLDKDFGDEGIYQYHFEIESKEDLDVHFPKVIEILSQKNVSDETLEKMKLAHKALSYNDFINDTKKISKSHSDILVSLKDNHVTIRLRNDSADFSRDQRAEFINKRREASKTDKNIVILEDEIEKIEVVDILNIHTTIFVLS